MIMDFEQAHREAVSKSTCHLSCPSCPELPAVWVERLLGADGDDAVEPPCVCPMALWPRDYYWNGCPKPPVQVFDDDGKMLALYVQAGTVRLIRILQ